MKTDTHQRIISYIRTNGQVRVRDLVRAFSPLGPVSIHRHLKKLISEGILKKIGKPPLVFYLLYGKREALLPQNVSDEAKSVIEQNYLYISPQGEILHGFTGFVRWATNTKQADKITYLADLYVKTRVAYDTYRTPQGWIDATFKLKDTFHEVYIDKLLYADFYSLTQFGKPKLGSMMLYAKQSQNRELAKEVSLIVKPLVERIIREFKIDTVVFIPPSIPRNIQFMDELSSYLALPFPQFKLVKTKTGQVIVAQKTLEKLEERIVNARDTIFTKSLFPISTSNILLIDDAVGSGATLNETAKKLHPANLSKKTIVGFAIVGSFRGFEVIREV